MSENGANNGRPELPEGWEWTTIGEVADCKLGKMLDKNKNRGTPRPYLRNVNVQWDNIDTSDLKQMAITDDEVERFSVRRGDLLICEGGEPGRCAIWERDDQVFFQKALHRVRPHDELDARFLLWQLRAMCLTGVLSRYFTGTTIKHLPGRQLAQVAIVLPPKPIQRAIVDAVAREFARISAIEGECSEIDRLCEQFISSCRSSAFDRKDQPQVALGSVAQIQSGITKNSKSGAGQEVPYLSTANVQAGRLDLSEVKTIAASEAQRKKHRLLEGDVLVLEGGDPDKVGRGWIWEGQIDDCLHQNHVFAVRPNERLLARYLAHYVNAPQARKAFLSRAKQTTGIASINKTQLRELEIPLPDLDTQEATVQELERSLDWAEEFSRQIEEARTYLAQLKRVILHRAFCGELAAGSPILEQAPA